MLKKKNPKIQLWKLNVAHSKMSCQACCVIPSFLTLARHNVHFPWDTVAVFNYEVLLNRKQPHRELKQFILNTVNNKEALLRGFAIPLHPENSQHVTPTEHTLLIKIDSHSKMFCLMKGLKYRFKWFWFFIVILNIVFSLLS